MNARELTDVVYIMQNKIIELEKASKNYYFEIEKLKTRVSDLEIDNKALQFDIERLRNERR